MAPQHCPRATTTLTLMNPEEGKLVRSSWSKQLFIGKEETSFELHAN